MNENKTKIAGILYKHGENDFSIWFPELTESEKKRNQQYFRKFCKWRIFFKGL